MKIDTKHYHMNLSEFHHLYLGLALVLLSYIMPPIYYLNEISFILGCLITIDDLIQHHIEARFIESYRVKYKTVKVYSTYLKYGRGITINYPRFIIGTILYKYLKIHQYTWVKKITSFMDSLFK